MTTVNSPTNIVRVPNTTTPETPDPQLPAAKNDRFEWDDFFDASSNKLVPKDGYLRFDVNQLPNGTRYPDQIRLANGSVAKVTPPSMPNNLFTISDGKQTLYATNNLGQLKFYEKLPTGTASSSDLRGGDGVSRFQAVSGGNLGQVFKEAYGVANGTTPAKLDPKTAKTARETMLDGRMAATMTQASKLVEQIKADGPAALAATKALGQETMRLNELDRHGDISVSTNEKGDTQVTLNRPPGTSDEEWAKLTRRFEPGAEAEAGKLDGLRAQARDAVGTRTSDAAKLWDTINQPEMVKHFASMTPPERMKQLQTYASALANTPYGDMLATQLFSSGNPSVPAVDPGGMLHPEPGTIGALSLQGAYDSPESRQALQDLTLTLAPDMPGKYGVGDPTQRMMEINLGRALTPDEKNVVQKLSLAPGPAAFAKVITDNPATAGELLGKLGDIGKTPEHAGAVEKSGGEAGAFSKLGVSVKAGATIFSAYSAMSAIGSISSNGLTVKNGLNASAAAIQTAGFAAETMLAAGSQSGVLKKVAAVGGYASDGLTMLNEVIGAIRANSPEGKDANVQQAALSVALIGATIMDAPVVAAGALLMKLVGPTPPSDSYDAAYGRLRTLDD